LAKIYTKAQKNAFYGLLWFGGGLVVTILTYALASNGGGGTYVVAWGPVIFGGIQLFRGLIGLAAGDKELAEQPSEEATVADRSHCPSCNRKVPTDVKYCPTCGRYLLA